MNVGNWVSLIEKEVKDSFWKMKYHKYEPDHELDFSFGLVVNPIWVLYDATFIEVITKFFKTKFSHQIKQQAAEKYAEFRIQCKEQI